MGIIVRAGAQVQPRILTLEEVKQGVVLNSAGVATAPAILSRTIFLRTAQAVILSGSVGLGREVRTLL